MPGYSVHTSIVPIGGIDYLIRALSDKQQYSDRDGDAERAGISSASWPLFGVLWPAGSVLAEAMSAIDIAGKRILEIGCGLGLSSLVLHRRQADITASDHHPRAGDFLAANALLNGLGPVPFSQVDWAGPNPGLGRFDLIIGSDVLYERGHAKLLALFFAEHAKPRAQVLIADPGRNHGNALNRAMADQGYDCSERRCQFEADESPPSVAAY
jgi:predicted nicotinamide N-methyase